MQSEVDSKAINTYIYRSVVDKVANVVVNLNQRAKRKRGTKMTQENTQEMTQENTAVALTQVKPITFHFRENRETKTKRPSITIDVAVPTIDGLAEIYNAGGRSLAKVLAVVEDAIIEHVRNVLTDRPEIVQGQFPADQATWEAYVAVPDAERAIRGISKEVWDAFKKDYLAVMPALTGKKPETIALGAKAMIDNRFSAVKTDKKAIGILQNYLAIYMQSANAENFLECVSTLDEKATTLLAADTSSLAENL